MLEGLGGIDLNGDLPRKGGMSGNDAAPTLRRGGFQCVRAAIGGFQRKMVITVPTATGKPQAQRIVQSGIPSKRNSVAALRIADCRPPFAQRPGESLAPWWRGAIQEFSRRD